MIIREIFFFISFMCEDFELSGLQVTKGDARCFLILLGVDISKTLSEIKV